MSSVFASSTTCSATCSTDAIRSGSLFLSFHGSMSDRYLFADDTTAIASLIAAFCRERASSSPIDANALLTRG